jgi:flagellar basal body-associated protein FliL
MSEENNEGGLSGLKKTIIGTIGTVVTAGGVWLTTHLGGGESTDKEETKTEQTAPAAAAPAPIVVNVSNNNTNQQKQQSNNSNSAKSAPAPVQQTAPVQAAPAQKESW